jgi:tetratricopeptide (TPR) repeat protein
MTPPTFASLSDLLAVVLEGVRTGNFGPKLKANIDFVFEHRQIFRNEGSEARYALTHSLAAEVYDQRGNYEEALKKVESLVNDKGYLPYLETEQKESFTERLGLGDELTQARKLARQKAMCCMAYGFALYRKRQYDRATAVLDVCSRFIYEVLVEQRGIQRFYAWGTRARLHYFKGQILRVQRKFSRSTKHFVKALDYARRRLQEKSKGSPEEIRIEQLFANHCAAKVLAFGLGWNHLLQGQLGKCWEFLLAARLILHDSRDHYLRWQIEFLCCSVRRAQKGVSEDLAKLLPKIESCCKHLRPHTEYYLQARHEHALILLNLGLARKEKNLAYSNIHFSDALQIIEEVLPDCDTSNRVLAFVLKSRVLRARNRPTDAAESVKLACWAYKNSGSAAPVRAEAAIASGEALLCAGGEDNVRRAVRLFDEGLRLSRNNLLVRSTCYLHLTEAQLKLDNALRAIQSFGAWNNVSNRIEHGWLRQKAEMLRASLAPRRVFLISANDARTFGDLSASFFRFLVEREEVLQGRDFSVAKAAARLGVKRDTFNEWREKVKAREPLKLLFRASDKERGRP